MRTMRCSPLSSARSPLALALALASAGALGLFALAAPARAAGDGAAAGAGALEVVRGGDLRFRWSRRGLSFDLRDRNGGWSAAEARMVADTLDGLPDLYIRKVLDGGVRTLYRDGALPHAPWNILEGPKDTRTAVAVPPAPWRYMAFGDRAFTSPEKCARTVVHELGHCVQWTMSGFATITTGTRGWTGISWTTGVPGLGLKSWNGFPSNYARSNHMEDFAEGCEWYWLAPFELYRASPAKYAFMRDVVFEGVFPPASVRVEGMEAIERVAPAITSLSHGRASPGALLRIRGDRFMAATDGGFNQVHVRGKRALHVPVTRTQLHAFVPALGEGSAPLTVTTQDGRSAPAAFAVKKPWWRFW